MSSQGDHEGLLALQGFGDHEGSMKICYPPIPRGSIKVLPLTLLDLMYPGKQNTPA